MLTNPRVSKKILNSPPFWLHYNNYNRNVFNNWNELHVDIPINLVNEDCILYSLFKFVSSINKFSIKTITKSKQNLKKFKKKHCISLNSIQLNSISLHSILKSIPFKYINNILDTFLFLKNKQNETITLKIATNIFVLYDIKQVITIKRLQQLIHCHQIQILENKSMNICIVYINDQTIKYSELFHKIKSYMNVIPFFIVSSFNPKLKMCTLLTSYIKVPCNECNKICICDFQYKSKVLCFDCCMKTNKPCFIIKASDYHNNTIFVWQLRNYSFIPFPINDKNTFLKSTINYDVKNASFISLESNSSLFDSFKKCKKNKLHCLNLNIEPKLAISINFILINGYMRECYDSIKTSLLLPTVIVYIVCNYCGIKKHHNNIKATNYLNQLNVLQNIDWTNDYNKNEFDINEICICGGMMNSIYSPVTCSIDACDKRGHILCMLPDMENHSDEHLLICLTHWKQKYGGATLSEIIYDKNTIFVGGIGKHNIWYNLETKKGIDLKWNEMTKDMQYVRHCYDNKFNNLDQKYALLPHQCSIYLHHKDITIPMIRFSHKGFRMAPLILLPKFLKHLKYKIWLRHKMKTIFEKIDFYLEYYPDSIQQSNSQRTKIGFNHTYKTNDLKKGLYDCKLKLMHFLNEKGDCDMFYDLLLDLYDIGKQLNAKCDYLMDDWNDISVMVTLYRGLGLSAHIDEFFISTVFVLIVLIRSKNDINAFDDDDDDNNNNNNDCLNKKKLSIGGFQQWSVNKFAEFGQSSDDIYFFFSFWTHEMYHMVPKLAGYEVYIVLIRNRNRKYC